MKIEYKVRKIEVNWEHVPVTRLVMIRGEAHHYDEAPFYLKKLGDRYVDGVFDSRWVQYIS